MDTISAAWKLLESEYRGLLNYALKTTIGGNPICDDINEAHDIVAAVQDDIIADVRAGGKKLPGIKNLSKYLRAMVRNIGGRRRSKRSYPKEFTMTGLASRGDGELGRPLRTMLAAEDVDADDGVISGATREAQQAHGKAYLDYVNGKDGYEDFEDHALESGEYRVICPKTATPTPLENLLAVEELAEAKRWKAERRKQAKRIRKGVRAALRRLPSIQQQVLCLNYFDVLDIDTVKGQRLPWVEHITGRIPEIMYIKAHNKHVHHWNTWDRTLFKIVRADGDMDWRAGGLTAKSVLPLKGVAERLGITEVNTRQLKRRGLDQLRNDRQLMDLLGLPVKQGLPRLLHRQASYFDTREPVEEYRKFTTPYEVIVETLSRIEQKLDDVLENKQAEEQVPRLRIVRSGGA